jgi:RNA polymerase sigma factor for flagellar operon FliA
MDNSPANTLTPTGVPPEQRARQRELWQRYHKAKRKTAVEGELIQQYLPLVKTVVGRIALTLPAHVDMEDLYSAGTVGLLNAMRNFDASNGASFETYARIRIRGAVLDELRRMDWAPRLMRDKTRKMQAVMQRLEQTKGALPTETEMAEALNIPIPEYQRWLEEIKPVIFICLDAVVTGDGEEGAAQYESVADGSQENPSDGASRRELTHLIVDRLQQLPEIQRKVLALYYFEDLRLREIAEAFGLTESRICQIHAQAILAIRAYLQKRESCRV